MLPALRETLRLSERAADFWMQRHPREETLPFDTIATGHGSPGQIFKLPEGDIRIRLASIERETSGALTFSDAANLQQLRRRCELDLAKLLDEIYSLEAANV